MLNSTPILVCGKSCRRFFDSALCYSSTTRIISSKLITCLVSSSSPATVGIRLIPIPARPVRYWLEDCRNIVPKLTDLNDLLVKRAAGAAAIPDRETYLMFRCCSIIVLTSLAQLYDRVARSSFLPAYQSIKFRSMCDDTLKDVARITVDFTKDDYSFLEPALSVSPSTT